MKYAICEEFFEETDKKLKRIAKKCQKCGNDFVYEVVGTEYRADEDHADDFHKFYIVEVAGTAKVDNWECVAVLDIHKKGNIIRKINTEITIPERFRTSENICDHCGTKRDRKNLYVIHNTETNEFKQVGGDCLKLYTGGLSMDYVAAWIDGITELEERDGIVSEIGKGTVYYDVEEVLENATAIIDVMGYLSSGNDLTTKRCVSIMMQRSCLKGRVEELNKELYKANIYNVEFITYDFCKKGTERRVAEIMDYYKNIEDDSEFSHNVKILLNEKYITARNFGYICYLPEGYRKHVEQEEERKNREKEKEQEKTDYYGEVGKRYKDIDVKSIKQVAVWETVYGLTHLYKIVLSDYSVLMWKASNGLDLPDDAEVDKISFTVKSHTEYKGEQQTQVTRCKVTIK